MSKYVYLYELDSVRKTDEEILIGQRALFNEIVGNGNTVALTYNQLVDSRGFFSLLEDEEYYESVISLFENGKIKISQYGEIRTVAQYLLNAVDEEKQFIYSALPLKYSQKRLTALLRRCLSFSDLSEIHGYLDNGCRSEDELRELFIEVVDGKLTQSSLSTGSMRDILCNLYSLIKTVLRISPMHNIYISPKSRDEYTGLSYHNYLEAVLKIENNSDPLWNGAISIIKSLRCLGNDNRSVYVREIYNRYLSEGENEEEVYRYAQAIVCLCYNYSCEASICNASKHYDSDEIKSDFDNKQSFVSDFLTRLSLDWNNGKDSEKRYLCDETNEFVRYQKSSDFPDFKEAVRVSGYTTEEKRTDGVLTRYEYDYSSNKKKRKRRLLAEILRRLILSAVCVVIACIFDFAFNEVQSFAENVLNFESDSVLLHIAVTFFETLVIIIAAELLTTFISRRIKGFLSLSDALSGIIHLFKDAGLIMFGRMDTYRNPDETSVDKTEKINTSVPIDCVRSKRLASYINAVNAGKDTVIFAELDEYPIADVNDSRVIKQLMRDEELYHSKFGIVYKSRYNTLMVDPVCDKKGNYFPYERIVPTAGNGVVTVPVINGRFLLMRQARHAVRGIQYSFPRGFAEPDESAEEIALRELKEEIGAETVGAPVYIGSVAADSGLTSCVAGVFAVEIKAYNKASSEEGIVSLLEVDEETLRAMIKEGKIDDGFTLSAYTLYTQTNPLG